MTDKKQNEVSESKEIPHEINSVSDLSQILQALGEPKEGHTRFFRGHADKDWQMLPSIYRAKHLIENEDKIIKDALIYCPDDFAPSDTLFEKLVKLQHYGYSTRLLDLTTNALVALYFAAQSYKEKKLYSDEYSKLKDGELIILDIPSQEIKYVDSDTVAILSAIALQQSKFDYFKCIEEVNIIAISEISRKMMDEMIIHAQRANIIEIFEKQQPDSKGLWDNYDPNICYSNITFSEERKIAFNNHKEITSLLHDIQVDKPSFRPLIDFNDLQRILCVRAKSNNVRISRQQGCFLLFGINGIKLKPAPDTILKEWQRFVPNSQKIIVKNKAAIMEELKSFGISKRTLFPELEAQATEIMNHYKPQKTK